MKKFILSFLICLSLIVPARQTRADLFGGDVVVLTKILMNAIEQLIKLQQLLSTAKSNLQLLQDVHSGLSNALNLISTIPKNQDAGLFGKIDQINDALHAIESVYGMVPKSKDFEKQSNTDSVVAEAVTINNQIYEYASEIDQIGEQIKVMAANASPKGAQRITAQSMGVMLHVMNQGLRAQAKGLKLQAQQQAVENSKAKDKTKHQLEMTNDLTKALNQKPSFTLPRF